MTVTIETPKKLPLNTSEMFVDKTIAEILEYIDNDRSLELIASSHTTQTSRNKENLAHARIITRSSFYNISENWVATYVAITKDGYLVTIDRHAGRSETVHSHDYFGMLSGTYDLNQSLKNMPMSDKDYMAAQRYLAKNPEALISKLTNVLNTQSKIMNDQQNIIYQADHAMSIMYPKTQATIRRLLSKFYTDFTEKFGFRQLKQAIEEHKDQPRNKKL